MLCGVTATLGSNPSATATAARPHWGRAVLLCLRGVCVGGLLPRQISGRRAACPPARRPRRELRSVRRLVVRPGPAGLAAASNRSGCLCVAWPRRLRASQPGPPVTAGALHAGGAWALIGGSIRRPETQLWLSTSNFACNSPEALSNHELTTLELQRFQILLKLLPIELYARFGWRWCRRLPRVSQSGPVGQASRWCETPVAFARAG